MSYASDLLKKGLQERSLSKKQKESRESMIKLGKEYLESAERLKERVKTLKESLDFMPLTDRKKAERRIELLEQEIREAKKTAAEVISFYEGGHRFLPRQNKKAVYMGAYLC